MQAPTEPLAGKNPVLEALRSGRRVTRIYLSETAHRDPAVEEIERRAAETGVDLQRAPPGKLDRLARGTTHQGVVALAERRTYATLDEVLDVARERNEEPFVILLDGVEDPHNLGAVLRVADGAGAHGVVVPGRGAVGLTPGVYKASAGAAEHVAVCQVSSLMDAVQRLKREDVWMGAAEANQGKPYYAEKLTGPLGLVLGSEGRGVSRSIQKHCDFLTHIPLKGRVNSLNVSTAAAVLAFERMRQVSDAKRSAKGRGGA